MCITHVATCIWWWCISYTCNTHVMHLKTQHMYYRCYTLDWLICGCWFILNKYLHWRDSSGSFCEHYASPSVVQSHRSVSGSISYLNANIGLLCIQLPCQLIYMYLYVHGITCISKIYSRFCGLWLAYILPSYSGMV